MANAAALGPQPDFTVMAAGCDETANTLTNTANTFANAFTNMAVQIRNCQNLPTVRGDNEVVTLLRRIDERLDRMEERLDRMEERLDRMELRFDNRMDRLESEIRRVNVHQLNNQARLENSHMIAGSVDEDLAPLYSLTAANAQPQVIANFPSRIEDISQLEGGRVNELLRHLEQGTTGNLAQRKTRLKKAVGGYMRHTGVKV
ncbi:hypothetical protein BU26DRAFT_525162 [Trematosphaeria pertusa]|uniref:Uncharacterized protein n=1 Tax=Trematosphaeria pertusa TaxID=390896 RepID=A0A6A6HT19_9PLEO|nr:uncharacterized protein BU26DRAFT_525162 [Trematosphaeria pertusa]KAF2241315.1 hypothetical protein BU26DRAFT_525162 [Trematosphaeria pertusa]